MSPPSRKLLIAVISITILAGLAGVGTAAQDDLVQLNSDGTVHIIDAQWSSTEVSEGQSFEFVITIQNTGKSEETGQFSFLQSGGSGASVTFSPETISYDLEPGERKRYRIEVMGDRNGITSSQVLDISIDTNGDGLPDQPADGIYKEITVYPASASISSGTINPSGERQSISKTFTQFKDNSSGILGGYDSNIPPVTSTSDGFEDNSKGRVFNFLRMSNNNNRPAIVEARGSGSGEARVGFAVRNVPAAEHYTVQLNYLFQDNNFTEAEVKVVDSNGVEIDKRTSYYINDTGQRETRYFTLTDKESQHLRQNKILYIVVDSPKITDANGERLSIFYGQLLSDDNYIKTTQTNILVDDMVTTTPTKWQNFNSDTQTLSDIQVDEYKTEDTIVVANKVHNYGNSVGTKQLVLYENGQITDQKRVTVNPGETISTVYTMSKSESGVYVFEPSGGDSAATAVVATDETIPPVARISETEDYHNGKLMADPLSNDSIHLDGSNSFAPTGDIVSYEWNLEWTSNRTGSEAFPTVSSQGTYQIVLTVEDSNGLADTTSETLYSGTTDPTAKTLTDTTVEVGESVPFDASNSSHEDPHRTIDSYQWDFADGTTGSGETIDHSFSEPGTYDVQLTVTDDLGNTDTDTRTIEVAPPQAHADITASPNEDLVGKQFSFDASNSYGEGSSTIESYTWNFGDGTTETTTTPTNTHTYSNAGNYTVEVVVENNYGETDSAVVSVSVLEEPFDIGIEGPTSSDTSTDINVNNDPTEGRDNVDSWTWNVEGQGTYTGKDSLTFNYNESGTYEVTLTGQTDEYGGFTDSETITINVTKSPPVAVIDSSYGDGESIYISTAISFDGSDSYDPDGTQLSYDWSIGQSNSQFTGSTINNYEYSSLGEHTSTLTVTDGSGETDTVQHTVTVKARDPVADFTYSPAEPTTADTIQFDGSASTHNEPRGDIVSYSWDIESKSSSTGQTTSKKFDNGGVYTVTLTVTDQWGKTDSISKDIRVVQDRSIQIPTQDLALLYTYEDASNPVPDRSENNNTGQWNGNVSYTTDNNGTVAYLDGSSYIEAANDPTLQFGEGGYTVSTWIKYSPQSGTDKAFIDKYGGDGDDGWMFKERDGSIALLTVENGGWEQTFKGNADTGNWVHVIAVRNPDGSKELWIDGTKVTEYSTGMDNVNDTSPLRLGLSDYGSYLNGYYDDTAIYSRSLTAEEINELYNNTGPNGNPVPQGNPESSTLTITNPTNKTPNDYQVNVTIARQPEMDTSYDSVRFWQNGNMLDYHLKSANSSEATFVVELDTLYADETQISMRYGSNTLNSASNPEDTYLVYDYNGNGMNQGTFRGDASDQGTYALLTEAKSSEQGSLRYGTFNTEIGLKATYQWRHWGPDSTPADSVNFVTYNNGNRYEHEDPAGNGIHFAVVDHSADYCVTVNYNGQCDIGSGNNYSYDENWHTASSSVANQGGGTYSYYYDSGAVNSPIYDGTLNASGLGNQFGFSGRTGGSTNNHAVRDITIRKWIGEKVTVTEPTIYSEDFEDGGTDGWTTNTGEETNRGGWLAAVCDTDNITTEFRRGLPDNRQPGTISYNTQIAAVDSWDGEYLRLQFKDDSGWNTVKSTTPQYNSGDEYVDWDCQDTWNSNVYDWSGTFQVDGELDAVRVVGGIQQDDNDESIAINYIDIEDT